MHDSSIFLSQKGMEQSLYYRMFEYLKKGLGFGVGRLLKHK